MGAELVLARLFLEHHGTLAKFWGPVIGPAVAMLSFVCSIGNVPLAAVLWNGGISFGGVLAFVFADLLILPILDIYRRYYGWRMAAFIFVTFYARWSPRASSSSSSSRGWASSARRGTRRWIDGAVTWNYTTYLNIASSRVAAVLVWRYFRRGGGWRC